MFGKVYITLSCHICVSNKYEPMLFIAALFKEIEEKPKNIDIANEICLFISSSPPFSRFPHLPVTPPAVADSSDFPSSRLNCLVCHTPLSPLADLTECCCCLDLEISTLLLSLSSGLMLPFYKCRTPAILKLYRK